MTAQPEKTIEVEGMHISWKQVHNHWEFQLEAPTTGWVALGFNTRNDIVGTNLIMAAVKNEDFTIEDQYVTAMGRHPEIITLGGNPAVVPVSGKEEAGKTRVIFQIPQNNTDRFHHSLLEGRQIWLICAYSQEDDFAHHSRMRRHVQIIL